MQPLIQMKRDPAHSCLSWKTQLSLPASDPTCSQSPISFDLKFRIEKKNNLVQVKIFLGRMDTSHSYSLINIFPIVL